MKLTKRAICTMLAFAMLTFQGIAFADKTIAIHFNGTPLQLEQAPVIQNERTLVPVRKLATEMGCSVSWDGESRSVRIENEKVAVRLFIDKTDMNVYNKATLGHKVVPLEVAPAIINDRTCLPIRPLADSFGVRIQWDAENRIIHATTQAAAPSPAPTAVPKATPRPTAKPTVSRGDTVRAGEHVFYFQNEERWALPNYGAGYCWVSSYAMLISDVLGKAVTPPEVAKVNLTKNENGAYCYHWEIISAFGVNFTSALAQDSEYLERYDKDFGSTYIKNPDQQDAVVIAALKEALDRNKAGVMVRFASFPHTVVATDYVGDVVYFNDPVQRGSEYQTTSDMRHVPFAQTIMGRTGMKLSDVTFLQALVKSK